MCKKNKQPVFFNQPENLGLYQMISWKESFRLTEPRSEVRFEMQPKPTLALREYSTSSQKTTLN